VAAELEEVEGGRLRLKVKAGATEALTVADLGVITSAGDLSKDLTLRSQSQQTLRSAYKMTTGKQRQRTVLQEESRLLLTNPAGAELTLVVRVSDDGVAFRYELPGPGDGDP
jgi:hypothetical protein